MVHEHLSTSGKSTESSTLGILPIITVQAFHDSEIGFTDIVGEMEAARESDSAHAESVW